MKILILILFFISIQTHAGSKHLPEGIAWHTGKVVSAFEMAKKQNKPLFLYWGAVWCPPCNYIKKNIFSTDLFKKEITHFIPIYLDGDSKEAQAWGDKLKTVGYPTMLILNPLGIEIMRLPIGSTVDDYVKLMARSRDTQLVMQERLDKAKSGKASDQDWELLAGYSWEQDPNLVLGDLYLKTPDKLNLEKSRLFIQQLLTSEKPDKNPSYFLDILRNQSLIDANLMSFIDSTPHLMKQVYGENQNEQMAAAKIFSQTLEKMIGNKKLVFYDQVGLYAPLIANDEVIDGKVSEKHLQQIKAVSILADKKTKGVFERQSVMSEVVDLLVNAKLFKEAKSVALKELKISKSPFYFMSELAEIAKLEGQTAEAVNWSKKAWLNSTGANTRFQWGVSYLNKLFELEPQNISTIKNAVLEVVTVGLANEEAFKGRNLGRFNKISKKLNEWGSAKGNSEIYNGIKNNILQLCQKNAMKSECLAWHHGL